MNDALEEAIIFEEAPDEIRIATAYLLKIKDRLGIPDDARLERDNKVIIAYAFQIYKVWAALFPLEHQEFIKETEFDLKYERPVRDAVKAGGYSPISYPTRLDRMYQLLLPDVKTQDKRFWIPLLKQIPELKRSNYLK